MALNVEFKNSELAQFGQAVKAEIRRNTLAGRDRHGRPLAPYSTRTFAMPAGVSGWRGAMRKLDVQYFRTTAGSLWAVIPGGYRALKTARKGSGGASPNLSLTGTMLRSMNSIVRGPNLIRIGFTNSEAAERAYYHVVSGAGKSRTRRDFLGLPEQDYRDIVKRVIRRPVVTLT